MKSSKTYLVFNSLLTVSALTLAFFASPLFVFAKTSPYSPAKANSESESPSSPKEESSQKTSDSSSEPSSKPKKYGEKPLVKIGDEQNYFKLGGYGSIRFEANSGEDLNSTFTFRRFVLTTDAKIASRLRIYSELEFERFRKIELERKVTSSGSGLSLVQEIEGTNSSEIAMEQAWFQIDFKDWLRFRGGGVLVPVGRFNINHDDNQWNLPRRTLADRGVPVLPSKAAWDELGMGFNGDVEFGKQSKISYEFYVVNGAVFEPQLEQKIQSRSGDTTKIEYEGEFGINTGTFSNDVKNGKAITGRVMYSPKLGHEFGVSAYWGRYTPKYLVNKKLTAFGFDTAHQFGKLQIEAQYLYSRLGGLSEVFDSFGKAVLNSEVEIEDKSVPPGIETEVAFKPSRIAGSKHGYWIEARYPLRPAWLVNSWFGKHFSDPQLIPVLRWEQVFLRGLVTDLEIQNGLVTKLETENRRVDRITAGLAFRLTPQAVLHAAYEYTQTNSTGSLASVVNYLETPSSKNHSVMLGAAFGF